MASMGGLVVKMAYILGHRDPEFQPVTDRVCSIVFLGTPHHGASIAQTLSRLVALVGARPFVNDLLPESPMLQSINEDFPRAASQLHLMSFYETKPMSLGGYKTLIVDKTSAVMNLANERRTLLDADHRHVAMFPSPNDPAYIAVRNALATLVSSRREEQHLEQQSVALGDKSMLNHILGISDAPEDDIMMQDSLRHPESCGWLSRKRYYVDWKDSLDSRLLWIRGRPGAGKSVLSGHVVNDLREHGVDCCFFFFQSSDKTKSSPNAFLRSMAWQMAMLHPEILSKITETSMTENTSPYDQIDPNPVWRKLFLSNILKTRLNRPQYWVIDSIDECKGSLEVMDFLMRIQESWPVAPFVTSRDPVEMHLGKITPRVDIQSQSISDGDIQDDIALLLKSNLDFLPCPASDRWPTPESMASQILANSGGCFLWASLICSELREVTSEREIDEVLGSIPADMDALYTKVLEDMANARFGKNVAKALITWATYAFRPLTTFEMQEPIELDIDDKVDDVARAISKCCGSMVYVDAHNKVQLVHATAREFLMRSAPDSDFTVSRTEGHRRLAKVCFQFLIKTDKTASRPGRLTSDPEVRTVRSSFSDAPPRSKRLGSEPELRHAHRPSLSQPTSFSEHPFTTYASKYVFQHLNFVHSDDEEIIELMSKFFSGSSVLRWIEYNAAHGDLQTVYQAGKTLNAILTRRSRYSPPLGLARGQVKLQMLEKWGDDLIHLVTKFSRQLRASPQSIHHLIPPFCPPGSAVRQQFSSPYRGLNVQGLSATSWDDCLATITYEKLTKPNAVAAGPGLFAVGMMTPKGKIVLYGDSIFQELHTILHGEPVWRLAFSERGTELASSGAKTVRIWSTTDGKEISNFKISSMCLALQFSEDDTILRAVTRQNQLIEWEVFEHMPLRDDPVNWTADLEEKMQFRSPTTVALGAATGLMCVIYRGENIVLWDYLEDRIHDNYEKETGSVSANGSHKVAEGTTTVGSVAFSHAIDTGLLAAAYTDGDTVVYDVLTGEAIAFAEGSNVVMVSSSPDGRTLAGVDSHGNLTLFEFSTLRALYRIQFDTPIVPKSIAFTSDSLRIIEVRGDQCRIWEPSVLLRADTAEDENSDTISVSTGLQEVDYQTTREAEITSMACCQNSSLNFYAVTDGSVYGCDISGEPDTQLLFVLPGRCPVHILNIDEKSSLLTTGDRSGRITVRKVIRRNIPKQQASWRVDAPMTDTKVSGGNFETLQAIITSGEHLRMLVSQQETDNLIPLTEDQGEPIAQLSRGAWSQWSKHPTKHDCLIRASKNQVEIYNWSDLDLIGCFETSSYGCTFGLVPLIQAQMFATWSTRTVASQETQQSDGKKDYKTISTIQLWGGKDEGIPGKDAKPIRQLDEVLASRITLILGSFGARPVVYTKDQWIATVDLHPPNDPMQRGEGLVRHFFMPSDWISVDHKSLIFGIGKAGEILFAKRSELAVIKRGLETTESGGSFNPRRAGAGQRGPLPLRLRGPSPGTSVSGRSSPRVSPRGSVDKGRPRRDAGEGLFLGSSHVL
ncbi:hypothetical protein SLS64_006200 [Diaporthe eres]